MTEHPTNHIALTGDITSPHYPSNYPNDVTQQDVIIVPTGAKVKITFLELFVEVDTYDNYCFDRVWVSTYHC